MRLKGSPPYRFLPDVHIGCDNAAAMLFYHPCYWSSAIFDHIMLPFFSSKLGLSQSVLILKTLNFTSKINGALIFHVALKLGSHGRNG